MSERPGYRNDPAGPDFDDSRPVIVFETHGRRKAHQNAFGAAVRAESEDRSAIVHQIELNITAATDLLPRAVPVLVRRLHPAPHDRRVRIEKPRRRHGRLLDGNVILMPGQKLFVAEACSGLRSLTSLVALAQAEIVERRCLAEGVVGAARHQQLHRRHVARVGRPPERRRAGLIDAGRELGLPEGYLRFLDRLRKLAVLDPEAGRAARVVAGHQIDAVTE